ncbi:hypothetical protein M427DRAFT_61239 [Gonapodya prolifera JEL478]|uniref:Uncharacterized protein n=1 Tax=Gonapodya prolifera (strain JEL478) TaxID=1344416 RepID=A0A139A3G9_GONPJ|nr:hypothetical protein M427DRAFT_61239 [Gonapodya prolifera JEL478]|eukprot:KXS11025.1 hypothetical protein M427DRAFT_61239 [Gonapodya prolifera JEL478]
MSTRQPVALEQPRYHTDVIMQESEDAQIMLQSPSASDANLASTPCPKSNSVWGWIINVPTAILAGIDYVGEKIAWVLGISQPMYREYIDEYEENRDQIEEEKRHDQNMVNARELQDVITSSQAPDQRGYV